MINRVVITGRLVRDPEKRVIPSGNTVAELTVAVDRQFKKEGEPDAYFFRVKAWGKTADFICNYGSKGRLVSVDGRLEQRSYQASDGQKRELIEIHGENISLLDRPKEGDA